MDWFKRSTNGLMPGRKKDLPQGMWVKCEKCGEIIYRKELERNLNVCFNCDFHFRIDSSAYLNIIADESSFNEIDQNMTSVDRLDFKDKMQYKDRIEALVAKIKITDAIRTGGARIFDKPVVLGVMDFRFIGGSMGAVVGEKIKRAVDRALDEKVPLIIVSSSGGARMQEGAISLMQMAKTSARLARFSKNGGLYISVLTNPTTAGVMASYAMLGDLIFAEPGALIGFAGPRVIKQTIGEDLPPGFQRSEFVCEHGFLDAIVSRKTLKQTLGDVIDFFKTSADSI